MKRVLIAGNSHVAALRLGWHSIGSAFEEKVTLSFFAAPGTIFSGLSVAEGSVLRPSPGNSLTAEDLDRLASLNGSTSITLTDYDHILVASVTWAGVDQLIPILKGFSIDSLYQVNKPRRLSLEAFDAFSASLSEIAALPPGWAELSGPEVSFMVRPMPTAEIREVGRTRLPGKRSLGVGWSDAGIETEHMRPVLDRHIATAKARFAADGIHLFAQPDTTRTLAGFTKPDLCRDSLALANSADRAFDPAHMNGEFGRLCLEAFLADILRPTAPTPTTPAI